MSTMTTVTRKGIGIAVIGLSFLILPALADPVLPGLTNLNFLSYTGSAPKNSFSAVNPVGWTGGTAHLHRCSWHLHNVPGDSLRLDVSQHVGLS